MPPSTVTADAFARAVAALRSAHPRSEITVSELAAPRRLAPYAYALGAAVGNPEADRPEELAVEGAREAPEIATGRLVLLYDPAGQPAWQGTMRLVTYVTAQLEADLAADTLMPEVGWSWLVEALESHRAGYAALAGTVTQTCSTRFGDLAGQPPSADLEIRASWTPDAGDDLPAHVDAWCTLLASAAGLPPPGVRRLHAR
jgi:hypothetical protein